MNLLFMIGSVVVTKMNENKEDDEENINCFSARGYLFLFPKKSKLEIVWCLLVTFAYGFFMTYLLHPITLFVHFQIQNE